MATIDDIREIAKTRPEISEVVEGHRGGVSWRTKRGGIIWERGPGKRDLEQLAELGQTWPDGTVVAVRVDGDDVKQALIASSPDVYFTIPHFDGYPAVLVQLDRIDVEDLRDLIIDGWLLRVSPRIAKAWLAEHGSATQGPVIKSGQIGDNQ
jgi:hypothetical protein